MTGSRRVGDRLDISMLDDGAMVTRQCVLLVDPDVGSGLAPLVERCGFKVLRSSTPEAALFEFGQHDFDAVVAALPLSGLGLAGLCQELRLRGRAPVLVATSGGDADALDALAAGADDHVSMPCDAHELRARLDALIRRVRGPLSPRRVVKIGELIVRLGRGVVSVVPEVPLTPVQSTLLGHLAGQPGVALGEHVLVARVRAVHGPTSDVQFDAELRGLRMAIELASGVFDAVEHIDGVGWRLAAERC